VVSNGFIGVEPPSRTRINMLRGVVNTAVNDSEVDDASLSM